MIKKIFGQLFSKELPKWFKFLNSTILTPVLLWPFVLFSTIFFFDNPNNLGLSFLLFLTVNIYPFYIVLIAYYNSKLFLKNRILGSILPISLMIFLSVSLVYLIVLIGDKINSRSNIDIERKKQGYIGETDEFKIIQNKVYYYDTLIVGADASTFETVSWEWQRDKQYYYFFGKRIAYIDRKSFQDLDYHYGKDKFNVYYDEKIIKGADASTFIHIEDSQDGKDKYGCYRYGKKINCKELLVEDSF